MISVNVADLAKDEIVARYLIGPHVQSRQLVNCEPDRVDGMAVVLECPEEQALSIVDLVRLHYPKNAFRFYKERRRI